jgi:transposase, IS30 family
MKYHQLTSGERYMLQALRLQGLSNAEIGRQLGRDRSTIGRELKRNCYGRRYQPGEADNAARARRSISRRRWYFSDQQLQVAISLIRLQWSPKQVSGWLKRHRILSISHQTLYRYIWYNHWDGGDLYKHLRQSSKRRRKRYGAYDSRGVMANKRHITERPISADNRSRIGHWELDTVIGSHDQHCIVTLVERKTKYTIIGKLPRRNTQAMNKRLIQLIQRERRRFLTITSDNGTEFHQYKHVEQKTSVPFYFCTPYHSWERGLNENTNGLIRQYLPKGESMAHLTQRDCDAIARKLNRRPRELLGFKSPEECYATT